MKRQRRPRMNSLLPVVTVALAFWPVLLNGSLPKMAEPAPKSEKTAITPRREQDFPEWYQQVIRAAELADSSDVRGCMVIRPWGFGIWENMQRALDGMIRAT